jgi:NAD(P)-dependent dehydrogenase (short-subunit alcohol dehydrogenase family)
VSNARMADKVCIVTGAASGIGRAIARLLAKHGALVVVADLTTEVIEGGIPTTELIAADGNQAVFIATDVASSAQVDALVEQAVARFGRLDVLVNNACIRHARPLLELESTAAAAPLSGRWCCSNRWMRCAVAS